MDNALRKLTGIKKCLPSEGRKEYTLYIDPTIIEAEKYDTKMTYKPVLTVNFFRRRLYF
ncbi:hypothetical protein QI155_03090 [Thermodesulfovibrio sp. 1176]|uniref:hypothetical protein n=1 Tax=Thermodesulfovibrio sp. 1176 TaxID=3043424 RepID=UPI0024825D60|nr:hypothetical protein [Thermodesulfovibrio sp. 1176]MDI1471509.1 hypothetical protein [Thermodesulfovibrio sp. 1176]